MTHRHQIILKLNNIHFHNDEQKYINDMESHDGV